MKADNKPVPELVAESLLLAMALRELELLEVQTTTSSTEEGGLKICPEEERPSGERVVGVDWSKTVDRNRANI